MAGAASAPTTSGSAASNWSEAAGAGPVAPGFVDSELMRRGERGGGTRRDSGGAAHLPDDHGPPRATATSAQPRPGPFPAGPRFAPFSAPFFAAFSASFSAAFLAEPFFAAPFFVARFAGASPCRTTGAFPSGVSTSRLRQRYQLATVACGDHRAPIASTSFGL